MQTLSAPLAHNALGAAVQMYAGILADHERQLQMSQAVIQQLKVQDAMKTAQVKSLEEIIKVGKEENAKLLAELKSRQGLAE
jgi:VIT1/CCC1 family predicted Fe2+/Mn2+ transporter